MKHILSFDEFTRMLKENNDNISEAILSSHYKCRKKYRIENEGNYTMPPFQTLKYHKDIELIENIEFPKDETFRISFKVDTHYVNQYLGGECSEDDKDNSEGSIGDNIHIIVRYNEIKTLFFGYKAKIDDCINLKLVELKDIYKYSGYDMSYINFLQPFDVIINNVKYRTFGSKFIVKIRNNKYFYHKNYIGDSDVFFNCKTFLRYDLYNDKTITDVELQNILDQIKFI